MPQLPKLSACRKEILSLFPSYLYLTSFHVRHRTNRTKKPVERDLQWLEEAGYLTSKPHPGGSFMPRVLYLTQAGWDWALEQKLFDKRVNATNEKGSQYLWHDLVLTDLHMKLQDLYGEDLYWTQLRQHCYRRFGNGENDRINPDAFFSFKTGNEYTIFFVEVEKSKDSVKLGKSARMSKVEAYDAYFSGPLQEEYGKGADGRVTWTFATPQKTLNFAGKLHDEGATRRHWILDENMIPQLTKETKFFFTPKDVSFEPAVHRFNAQKLYSLNDA